MLNFIILIGGPGLFVGCDKKHDQSWRNYFVPMQLAAMNNIYKKLADETVHWVVYEPAYRERWNDDSVITSDEKKQDDGYNLHSIRLAAANKVLKTKANSYLHRIQVVAKELGITYKGIQKPAEFWAYLTAQPNESISRTWYSGHASGKGLMLSLTHDACEAVAKTEDMVMAASIKGNAALASKFSKKSTLLSKFYGCYTKDFAQNWHEVFGVPTAGAINKIDFSVVDSPTIGSDDLLTRIEKTPTSQGATGWTEIR